jgi:hypothetical protein
VLTVDLVKYMPYPAEVVTEDANLEGLNSSISWGKQGLLKHFTLAPVVVVQRRV